MTDQPKPILSTLLPVDAPEWEYATVLGTPRTLVLVPGQTGPIVVRRRITYGRWEAVTPDRFADDPTGTDNDTCGSEPPRGDDHQWGDCWCTKPASQDHDECLCEPCHARHGTPGWANPKETP